MVCFRHTANIQDLVANVIDYKVNSVVTRKRLISIGRLGNIFNKESDIRKNVKLKRKKFLIVISIVKFFTVIKQFFIVLEY